MSIRQARWRDVMVGSIRTTRTAIRPDEPSKTESCCRHVETDRPTFSSSGTRHPSSHHSLATSRSVETSAVISHHQLDGRLDAPLCSHEPLAREEAHFSCTFPLTTHWPHRPAHPLTHSLPVLLASALLPVARLAMRWRPRLSSPSVQTQTPKSSLN
jgi:hypothetical protein